MSRLFPSGHHVPVNSAPCRGLFRRTSQRTVVNMPPPSHSLSFDVSVKKSAGERAERDKEREGEGIEAERIDREENDASIE